MSCSGRLLLGYAGAGGVSAGIVVSMNQIVMVPAQVLSAVGAEFSSGLAAAFLMFLQLLGTAESADIAHFNFLTCLQRGVQSNFHAGSRLDNTRMRSLRPCASTRLRLRMRLGLRMGLGF